VLGNSASATENDEMPLPAESSRLRRVRRDAMRNRVDATGDEIAAQGEGELWRALVNILPDECIGPILKEQESEFQDIRFDLRQK
jgi:hypothetical protein